MAMNILIYRSYGLLSADALIDLYFGRILAFFFYLANIIPLIGTLNVS